MPDLTPETNPRPQVRSSGPPTPQGGKRWWLKSLFNTGLSLGTGLLLIASFGAAQRMGWIRSGGTNTEGRAHEHASNAGTVRSVDYICPMMCTPPQDEPGRCPVCAMELVPATFGGGNSDSRSIQIDPVARRVANIRTVPVRSMPMARTIRAIGELSYDEGSLKTISAYVDGRLERLYADYTGVVVKKGDHLALVYSPRLYSGQVELLLAKQARENNGSSSLQRIVQSNDDLYVSARQRLIELGMTEPQLEQLEQSGQANSRMHLCAPISGTVIEKMAVEGQYVKEGQAIYKLADLSTVWVMLKLFPEDAATIRYGQKVKAAVQSLPGRKFTGRVAFIDHNVDPKTRTVGVRVVMPNEGGLLRVGDYAKATIDVPLAGTGDEQSDFYDPELANKWISPRHPHIVEAAPGKCPICSVELVAAAQFGYTAEPTANDAALVVPRDAVLMAGDNSVLYVETEPGRFEIRRVVLGPNCGDQIVILSGVTSGEQVATRGNFLIDSQMQLAGNPSLIDPTKAKPHTDEAMSAEMIAALSELSPEDHALVKNQRVCPVAEYRLGSMGTPIRVDVNGTPVFICCEGCRESLLDEPEKYLAKLAGATASEDSSENTPMDLPPIGVPEIIDPPGGLPPIEAPQAILERSTENQQSPDQPTKRVTKRLEEVVR